MRTIVVVSKPGDWPLEVPGVEVVLAREYLTETAWVEERGVRVFNLCRSFGYQSAGYYVSLLAAARRHRPLPDLMTLLDMRSRNHVRSVDEDLDLTIQKSFAEIRSGTFELSVYFGQNVAARHGRLSKALFMRFPAPLLRASFERGERWSLTRLTPIGFREVPASHHTFLHGAATSHFERRRYRTRVRKQSRYDLAILRDPDEVLAPSDPKALERFRVAAEHVGFGVEMIGRDDFGRLAEFDALFIRETTAVNHHTFRFAHRAESEGIVVVDDPQSILRCTNKVFQTETFERAGVPVPKTWITPGAEAAEVERRIGFPCVLKIPDSAFSQGVMKCADADEFEQSASRILRDTELLLVQEFMPSDFDWRVGIFGGEALYACRYRMARGHWQIVKKTSEGRFSYGKTEPVALEEVPPRIIKIALKAASVIGDGLYGVDLKQVGQRIVVTEVNDNPNVDAGCEDAILGKELYRHLMAKMMERVESKKRGG